MNIKKITIEVPPLYIIETKRISPPDICDDNKAAKLTRKVFGGKRI